jgi:hypothetical protein
MGTCLVDALVAQYERRGGPGRVYIVSLGPSHRDARVHVVHHYAPCAEPSLCGPMGLDRHSAVGLVVVQQLFGT